MRGEREVTVLVDATESMVEVLCDAASECAIAYDSPSLTFASLSGRLLDMAIRGG